MPDDLLVLRDVRRPGSSARLDVVVADGRIAAVRPMGELVARHAADLVDLGGRTVIPGLWDMHAHVTQWALARARLDLVDARSAADAARRVAEALAARDTAGVGDLLVGRRLRLSTWPDQPHRDLLDRVAPSTPVVLQNIDLHTVWCNTTALARFDRADHPTGVLREDECYRIIQALPDGTTAQRDEAVRGALADAAARGVVGITDFEFGDPVVDWRRRAATGRLDVRIDASVYPAHLDAAVARGWPTGMVVPETHGLVRAAYLKLFVDGAMNSGTALCHDALSTAGPDRGTGGGDVRTDPAAAHGHLAIRPEELRDQVERAWHHGITPAIHAIGDLAVTVALDGIEAVGCPARIEHAQLVADADLPRFDRPDLVAGVQPAHCTDDRDVTDTHWADRADRAYRFADLVTAGARLEFGSDAPVSALDPWAAIAAAVTRTDDDRPAWHPEQCLDVATALAASARGRDSVRTGDPADLAVLDDDPVTIDPSRLRDMSVAATVVAGRFAHGPSG